jgi:hypothetical protein
MLDGIYYLNNSGSKWVIYRNGSKVKVKVIPDKYNNLKKEVVRTAIYFEAFGNFASVCVSIGGKKISTLSYKAA